MRVKIFICLQFLGILSAYAGDNIGRGGLGGLDEVFAILCLIGLVIGGIVFVAARIGGNKDDE